MISIKRSDGKIFSSMDQASKETGLSAMKLYRFIAFGAEDDQGMTWSKANAPAPRERYPKAGIVSGNRKENGTYDPIPVLRSDGQKYSSLTKAANSVSCSTSALKRAVDIPSRTCGGYKWMSIHDPEAAPENVVVTSEPEEIIFEQYKPARDWEDTKSAVKLGKVYLAGKVQQNGWRHGLFRDRYSLRDAMGIYCRNVENTTDNGAFKWSLMESALLGHIDYVGPYFVSCDHGCMHGENTHGYGSDQAVDCSIEIESKNRHHEVIKACKKAVLISDTVFAWIECDTCYATLFELGYAAAHKKKIIVASNFDMRDLWFVKEWAELYGTFIHARSAKEAWSDVIACPRILSEKDRFEFQC